MQKAYKTIPTLQHRLATMMVIEKRYRNRILNNTLPLATAVGRAHEVSTAIQQIKTKNWNSMFTDYTPGDTTYDLPKVSLANNDQK
ncbi:hypothetical protein E2P81_ATG10822 [Venturia nashicola]|uniref:Uncharacterized protein n=1 Tax=Venturia nashicola TaxID=86259 RepID=A0A4Z1NPY6_9PEZI|nr:hypothetical protein E6O75_ATG10495 [Venturia nashicola]TLD27534.1 hypothetical protein E2P81_ATG10822 [Venturia nashicola]